MTESDRPSSVLQLTLQAGAVLERGGFRSVSMSLRDQVRVYEDEVCLVGIVGYSDWPALSESWLRDQEDFGRAVGRRLNATDAKAWDTYLVLMVAQELTDRDREEAISIRYNTRRARKIVITGDDVRGPNDLELALMPVRPLIDDARASATSDPLDELSQALGGVGLEAESRVVIEAFRASRPLLEALHDWRVENAVD